MTSQICLVGLAVMVPMVFPQVMPQTQLLTKLAPPVAPGPQIKGDTAKRPRATHATVMRPIRSGAIFMPRSMPPRAAILVDEIQMPEGDDTVGVVGGGPRGSKDGVPGGLLSSIISVAPVVPKPPVKPPETKAPEPTVTTPRVYREGGRVHLGRLLHKVEPLYPPIAKAARVSGMVELECLVGVDGRVKELKVLSGNPLLTGAARDAVFQWVYEGSRLNDAPIEIIANISIAFKLN